MFTFIFWMFAVVGAFVCAPLILRMAGWMFGLVLVLGAVLAAAIFFLGRV